MEGNQDAQQNMRREREREGGLLCAVKVSLKILLSLVMDHLMCQTTESVILTNGLRIQTTPSC